MIKGLGLSSPPGNFAYGLRLGTIEDRDRTVGVTAT